MISAPEVPKLLYDAWAKEVEQLLIDQYGLRLADLPNSLDTTYYLDKACARSLSVWQGAIIAMCSGFPQYCGFIIESSKYRTEPFTSLWRELDFNRLIIEIDRKHRNPT